MTGSWLPKVVAPISLTFERQRQVYFLEFKASQCDIVSETLFQKIKKYASETTHLLT